MNLVYQHTEQSSLVFLLTANSLQTDAAGVRVASDNQHHPPAVPLRGTESDIVFDVMGESYKRLIYND